MLARFKLVALAVIKKHNRQLKVRLKQPILTPLKRKSIKKIKIVTIKHKVSIKLNRIQYLQIFCNTKLNEYEFFDKYEFFPQKLMKNFSRFSSHSLFATHVAKFL